MFSAKNFRCRSLVTSILGKEIGGCGFIIKLFGATKFNGGWVEGENKVENTYSINLQLANLALSMTPVAGSRYLIMDGE